MAGQRAPLTHALALSCVAVHVALLASGGWEWAVIHAGFIPERWSGTPVDGALPALLTPLSAAFLHASLLHLAMNLLVLVFIGRQLEPVLGARTVALLLLAGAYGGALVEWLFAGATAGRTVIGASGAISALIAVYAFIFNRNAVRGWGPVPAAAVRALWLAAAWIGLQLAVGFAFGGIAIFSHIGGFIAGLILARPLLRRRFR